MIQLNRLRKMLLAVELNEDGEDTPIWVWNNKKMFTIKSGYNNMFDSYLDRSFDHLWKAKNPIKNQDMAVADMAQCHCHKRQHDKA